MSGKYADNDKLAKSIDKTFKWYRIDGSNEFSLPEKTTIAGIIAKANKRVKVDPSELLIATETSPME